MGAIQVLRSRQSILPRMVDPQAMRAMRERVIQGCPDQVRINKVNVEPLTNLIHQIDDDRYDLFAGIMEIDSRCGQLAAALQDVLGVLRLKRPHDDRTDNLIAETEHLLTRIRGQ